MVIRARQAAAKFLLASAAAWVALAPAPSAADKNAPPSEIIDPPRPPVARPVAPPQAVSPELNSPRTDRIKSRSYVNSKRNRARKAVSFEQKSREESEMEEAPSERRARRDMVSEPWLAPTGDRLVAVVDDRMMTKPELDMRVNLVLKDDPLLGKRDWESRRQLSDKQIDLAQTILLAWVETTTLALEAERIGIKVTAADVEASLAELASESDMEMGRLQAHAKLIGIPQEQLRQETRDALLVEQYVLKIIRATDRKVFEDVFANNPGQFLLPPRARVFHMSRQLDPALRGKDEKKAASELEKLRKPLNKAATIDECNELAKLSNAETGLAIGDMGWVSADMGWLSDDTDTQSVMLSKIFSAKIGQASEVFAAGHSLHVIKVLERTEGSKPTLEDAMPQIEAFMFEKTKTAAYDMVRAKHKINFNSGGLNRWREAGGPGEGAIVQAKPDAKSYGPVKPIATPRPVPTMKPQAPPPPAEPPEVSLDLLPSLQNEPAPKPAKPSKAR